MIGSSSVPSVLVGRRPSTAVAGACSSCDGISHHRLSAPACPVQSSKAAAACQRASTSRHSRRAPRRCAWASKSVCSSPYTTSNTTCPAVTLSANAPGTLPRAAHSQRCRVDHETPRGDEGGVEPGQARATRTAAPGTAAVTSAASRSAAAGVRSTTVSGMSRRASASATARAAPPAPSNSAGSPSQGVAARVGQRAWRRRRRPCCGRARRRRSTIVFTAPMRRGVAVQPVEKRDDGRLMRHGDVRAAKAECRRGRGRRRREPAPGRGAARRPCRCPRPRTRRCAASATASGIRGRR